MLLRCESLEPRMSLVGLGCAKTPAVAPHVEISPGNCIPESQIILHTRGSMPCWRIVFSTFCGCMSFYTRSVKPGHRRDVRRMTALAPKADFDLRSCDVADVPQPDVSNRGK